MKVVVISIFFPPERGAAPSRIMNTVKELKKRGCEVEVITALANYPTGKIFPKYKGKLFVKEEVDGITCRRFWLFPSNSNNPFVRVFNMFSFSVSILFSLPYLFKWKPEAVIIQSPPLLAGLAGVFLGKIIGAKVFANISDVWPLTAKELGVINDGIAYSFFEIIEKMIYKYSDAFIGQSKETLSHIQKFQDKPRFLYRNLAKTSPYINDTSKLSPSNYKIVYAGLLGLAQGVLSICEKINFKELGIEFHIYGNGVQRSSVEEFIKNNPDSNVYLHDSIPKSEVQEMLSNYHATIIPLTSPIYGAFPSKVFMAVAAGLPMFFSGGREGEVLVKDLEIGWVSPPGDLEGLESNLKEFTTISEDDYFRYRQNCISASQGILDYDNQQKDLMKFIEKTAFYENIDDRNKRLHREEINQD